MEMEIQEFCDYVKDNVLKFMPQEYEGAEVFINKAYKNNSVVLHGLTIRRYDKNMAPSLYMEYPYQEYQNGKAMEEIISDIAREYEEHDKNTPQINASFDGSILNFDKIKDHITTRVLNAKQNKTIAAERPTKKLDDLLVFYQITIEEIGNASGNVLITNKMLKKWNVDIQEIHNLAVENTERLFPSELISMEYVSSGIKENLFEKADEKPECFGFILTNEENYYGASAIANPNVLQKVSDVIKDDYFILPSSVSEVIIIPKETAKEMGQTPKEFGAMVRSINSIELSKEEFLSDHIYSYDREKKVLETVRDSIEKSMDMER